MSSDELSPEGQQLVSEVEDYLKTGITSGNSVSSNGWVARKERKYNNYGFDLIRDENGEIIGVNLSDEDRKLVGALFDAIRNKPTTVSLEVYERNLNRHAAELGVDREAIAAGRATFTVLPSLEEKTNNLNLEERYLDFLHRLLDAVDSLLNETLREVTSAAIQPKSPKIMKNNVPFSNSVSDITNQFAGQKPLIDFSRPFLKW